MSILPDYLVGLGVAVKKDNASGYHIIDRAKYDADPDAYELYEGDEPDKPKGYAAMTVPKLQALADERGIEVEGSGKGGNVVKDDLVKALEAAEPEA